MRETNGEAEVISNSDQIQSRCQRMWVIICIGVKTTMRCAARREQRQNSVTKTSKCVIIIKINKSLYFHLKGKTLHPSLIGVFFCRYTVMTYLEYITMHGYSGRKIFS